MYLKTNKLFGYLTALSGGFCAFFVTTGNNPFIAALTAAGTIVGFFATVEGPPSK